MGWYKKIPDYTAARHEVETIGLLARHEVTRLFPEGTLHKERFAGLTVSFVIYAGWPARERARSICQSHRVNMLA